MIKKILEAIDEALYGMPLVIGRKYIKFYGIPNDPFVEYEPEIVEIKDIQLSRSGDQLYVKVVNISSGFTYSWTKDNFKLFFKRYV